MNVYPISNSLKLCYPYRVQYRSISLITTRSFVFKDFQSKLMNNCLGFLTYLKHRPHFSSQAINKIEYLNDNHLYQNGITHFYSDSINDNEELSTTLIKASNLLLKKERHLQKREDDIKKATELLKKQNNYMDEYKSHEVLRLNIGGENTCSTLRKTLCLFGNSALASKFSGRWDDRIEKDKDGNFFIDQPVELFRPLLNYLRAKSDEASYQTNDSFINHHGASNIPPVLSPKVEDRLWYDFIRMIECYGLTEGVFPTTINIHRGNPDKASIIKSLTDPNTIVSTKQWSTFIMKPYGHNREIKSFEIELGNVESPCIGWAKIQDKCFNKKDLFIPYINNDDNNCCRSAKGVGQDKQSVALGLGYSSKDSNNEEKVGISLNGTFISLDNGAIEFKQGTKIRCEDRGNKWYVNDALVAVGSNTSIRNKNEFMCKNGIIPNASSATNGLSIITEFDLNIVNLVPAFSGKGDWRVTKVELDA